MVTPIGTTTIGGQEPRPWRQRWTDATAEAVALAMAEHYLDPADQDRCVCDRWSDGGMETEGWDDHMAEVALEKLADMGLLVVEPRS